ncbi:MAG: sugar ABC transporter substrate-binding protein, partial [Rectinemataceae bacterium]
MKKAFILVAVLAMVFAATAGVSAQTLTAAQKANLEASLKVDVAKLKSADNQSLIVLSTEKKVIPARPANPDALPETDPLHWYDIEYAGWNAKKVNIPKSPGDGAIGKKIIFIVHGDHPWTTACTLGAKKVADAYKMQLKTLSPNWDLAVQNQMIDQAINERPDAICLIPLDAKSAPQQAKKINDAGIPLFLFNTLTDAAAMNYSITWTGPDDFGQFRMLARAWADELKKRNPGAKEIDVAYVQHNPGGSPYYARCWGPISELSGYAPIVKTVAKDAPGFEADKSAQVVSDWLTRFGKDLKGICASDDSAQSIGIFAALEKVNRTDLVVVAAGNSKPGMDLVKAGKLFAITFQTAEGDGALTVATAADWFNGKAIEPVRYLPKQLITKANVDQFYPPQW